MRAFTVIAIAIVAVVSTPVAADEAALTKALASPTATGLLVTMVGEGSQAEKAGMETGDILISYAGKPATTIAALNAAKAGTEGMESVEIKAVRDGKAIVFSIAPGPIGINGIPVTEGKAAPGLPASTNPTFDFRSLAEHPRDDWYVFQMPGAGKVGFEHVMLRIEDGKLVMRREVAFAGGEQWGLNHFDVTVTMTATNPPRVLGTRFRNPVTKWVGEGVRDDEKGLWQFAWGGEGHESGKREMPLVVDHIPDYIVDSLAAYLPREKGTCLHYSPLITGWPGPTMRTALHCTGEEEILIDGKEAKAWRFSVVGLGGAVQTSHWVDGNGRIVRSDYGGPIVTLSTKEKALAGLDEKIRPRTAGSKPKSDDPLTAAMANPADTGLLVVRVATGSQAEKVGVLPGDIIVAYNGEATGDIMSLGMAKERANALESVEVSVVRDRGKRVIGMKPGQLGLYLLPVTKGVEVESLPPGNVREIDLAPLEGKPRDAWHAFYGGDDRKLGYIRITARVNGGRLFVKSEFGFDQRPEGGLYRSKTSSVVTADLRPRMTRQTQHFGNGNSTSVTGFLKTAGSEHLTWGSTGRQDTVMREIPTDSIPMIVTMTLAELMPRKKGACLRFHPLYESVSDVALPSALVCTGEEEGRWRYELRQIGGVLVTTYFVGPDGETARVEHVSGTRSIRVTKEKALEGLPKGLLFE